MAARSVFVGVMRERVYSPGKVEADRAILDETAAALERHDVVVRVVTADDVDTKSRPPLVFAMCQGPGALARLRAIERRGVPVVHRPSVIEACHRHRMARRTLRARVPRPLARVVSTTSLPVDFEAWVERHPGGVWVKRGDVHATETGDVTHVYGGAQARLAIASLARRGVAEALIEEHIEGETIKFYGVRGTGFFRAYRASDSRRVCAEVDGWPALCDRAAAALGLEIYGGDLVVRAGGDAVLVDLNDWPSFSACRSAAAEAIAERLLSCSRTPSVHSEART